MIPHGPGRPERISQSISVIVPCYHDESRLRRLLGQMGSLPCRPKEILVIDAADSPECRALCQEYGTIHLPSTPCRGRQLRAGADRARGTILWFLHADVRLSGDPLTAMTRVLAKGAVGGYFRFRFDGPRSWQTTLLEKAIALRSHFGIPYGDQGLFMTRETYFLSGGHAPWPLFEEVPLVQRLRRIGRFSALREVLLVDPRRWIQEGWWRRTWRNRSLALFFALGVSPERLAVHYQHRSLRHSMSGKEQSK